MIKTFQKLTEECRGGWEITEKNTHTQNLRIGLCYVNPNITFWLYNVAINLLDNGW